MEELGHGTFWRGFGSETGPATLRIQTLIFHLFALGLLNFFAFPKRERLLFLLRNFNRLLFDFEAALLVCFLDCLVARH